SAHKCPREKGQFKGKGYQKQVKSTSTTIVEDTTGSEEQKTSIHDDSSDEKHETGSEKVSKSESGRKGVALSTWFHEVSIRWHGDRLTIEYNPLPPAASRMGLCILTYKVQPGFLSRKIAKATCGSYPSNASLSYKNLSLALINMIGVHDSFKAKPFIIGGGEERKEDVCRVVIIAPAAPPPHHDRPRGVTY
ncbi:hypothetical protein C0J52_24280, partial [Blattella germanica]